MANVVLTFAAFLLAVNSALAITCYKCDSSQGISCGYGLLSFSYDTEDCNRGSSDVIGTLSSLFPKKCYKLVGEDKNGKEIISRGCVPSTGPVDSCNAIAKTLQLMESNTLNKLECFTCDTDKCNSAPKLTGITVGAVLLACFVFLF